MPQPAAPSRSIDELCVDADYAWADGDLLTLREVTDQLAERAPEPIHRQLLELSEACVSDPERALVMWAELKERIPRG
jgi:hypothetical protein